MKEGGRGKFSVIPRHRRAFRTNYALTTIVNPLLRPSRYPRADLRMLKHDTTTGDRNGSFECPRPLASFQRSLSSPAPD